MRELERFEEAMREMTGMLCWLPCQGHGSMLTLQFGEPWLKINEPRRSPVSGLTSRLVTPRGEWDVWVKSGVWALLDGQTVLADPFKDDTVKVQRALRYLNGQRLEDVGVSDQAIDFIFDLGATLRVPLPQSDDDDSLTLFRRGEAFWTPGAGPLR